MRNIRVIFYFSVTIFISQPLLASENVRFYANGLFSLYLPVDILSGSVISPVDDFLIDLKDKGSIHIETVLSSESGFNHLDMRKIPKYLTGKKIEIENDRIKSDLDAVKMLLTNKFPKSPVEEIKMQDLTISIFKNKNLAQIYITDKKNK